MNSRVAQGNRAGPRLSGVVAGQGALWNTLRKAARGRCLEYCTKRVAARGVLYNGALMQGVQPRCGASVVLC